MSEVDARRGLQVQSTCIGISQEFANALMQLK